jgi:hypothetical protein
MTDPQNPAEALASIQAARARMVDRGNRWPLIYDILFSLPVAAMIAWQGLPDPWPLFGVVLIGLFVVWAQAWWKKRFGYWVDAYKPKKARWIAFGLLAVLLPLLGLAIWTRYGGPWWMSLAAGGVAWPVMVIGSRWWGRVWRRELRETT